MSDIQYPKMTVPEFVLWQTLTAALTFVRQDYAAAVTAGDNTKSWLYRACLYQGFQLYDFFTQAQQVICAPEDDPRYLNVNLMFNMERQGPPSIHITLPAEQTMPNGNGLGNDEGYFGIEQVTEADPDEHVMATFDPVFTRRYSAIYNIVVTSDNSNEIIFLHHFVKALLTACIPHLHFMNLQNIKLGGQDIQPYNELVAQNLYMRAVQVSLEYDTSVPSINLIQIPNGLVEPLGGKPSYPLVD